jgi:hypothetical protein
LADGNIVSAAIIPMLACNHLEVNDPLERIRNTKDDKDGPSSHLLKSRIRHG